MIHGILLPTIFTGVGVVGTMGYNAIYDYFFNKTDNHRLRLLLDEAERRKAIDEATLKMNQNVVDLFTKILDEVDNQSTQIGTGVNTLQEIIQSAQHNQDQLDQATRSIMDTTTNTTDSVGKITRLLQESATQFSNTGSALQTTQDQIQQAGNKFQQVIQKLSKTEQDLTQVVALFCKKISMFSQQVSSEKENVELRKQLEQLTKLNQAIMTKAEDTIRQVVEENDQLRKTHGMAR